MANILNSPHSLGSVFEWHKSTHDFDVFKIRKKQSFMSFAIIYFFNHFQIILNRFLTNTVSVHF